MPPGQGRRIALLHLSRVNPEQGDLESEPFYGGRLQLFMCD